MSTINIDLAADTILNVMIGQQDENEVREVIFDFSGWYTTYGSGTISLAIQRPKDEWPYEGTLTVDSTNHKATWEISETDTAYAGTGQIQLSYKVGDAKKKSVVYRFTCHKSLGALGSVVTPVQIQTFIDEVEEALQTMDGRLDDMDDQITDVKADLFSNGDLSKSVDWESGLIDAFGHLETGAGFFRTADYLTVIPSSTFTVSVGGNGVFFSEYKADGTFLRRSSAITADGTFTIGSDAYKVKLITRNNPVNTSATSDIVNNISVIGQLLTTAQIVYDLERVKETANKAYADTSNYIGTIADKNTAKASGNIIWNTGVVATSATWYYTDYINVSGKGKISLLTSTFSGSSYNTGLAFYDTNKAYISGIEFAHGLGENGTLVIEADVPDDAVYMRTSLRIADWDDFFVKFDKLSAITELSINTYAMQLFEKIGVIGDSISVGWARDKNGNNSRRNTGISWVQQMARRLGCTAYNLGASGVDPIEWFQTNYEFYEYCYPQYVSVGFCDLYIIGLGLNQGTLGSVSDINQSDYTQNGATFYGQYARIVQMINAEHPNAIVMCLTEPTTAISSYDQAVRDICALNFINAELVDLENDYFDLFNTPEILAEHQPDNLHFTPYGYSLLADATVKALSDYIANNPTPFKYVGVATV